MNEETILLEIEVRYEDAIRGIAEYTSRKQELTAANRDLQRQVKEEQITQQEANEQIAANNIRAREYTNSIRLLQREIQNNIRAEQNQEGSLVSLRATLSNVTRQYDELSRAERESAQGTELLDKITQIQEELNEAEQASGRWFRTVGKYEPAFASALTPLIKQLDDAKAAFMALNEEQRRGAEGQALAEQIQSIGEQLTAASASAAEYQQNIVDLVAGNNALVRSFLTQATAATTLGGALTVLRTGVVTLGRALLALLANPIVAVIAAITAAVMALVSIFTRAIDVIRGNEEQFNRLRVVMAPFQALTDVITRAFESFGDVLLNIAEFIFPLIINGLVSIAEFFGLSTTGLEGLRAETERYTALERDRVAIQTRSREVAEENAKIEQNLAQLRANFAARDKFTNQERLAFLDEIQVLETRRARNNVEIAEENLRLLEQEVDATRTSTEELDKLSQARIAVTQATTAYNAAIQQVNTQRVEAINAMNAETKAENDAAKQRTEAAKKTREEITKNELEALRALEDAQNELIVDSLKRQEAQARTASNRRIEDLNRRLNEEKNLNDAARQAINNLILFEQEALNRQLLEIEKTRLQERSNIIQTDLNNRLAALRGESVEALNIRIELLEREREAEIAEAERIGTDVNLIRAKYERQIIDERENYERQAFQKLVSENQQRYELLAQQAILEGRSETDIRIEQKQYEIDTLQQLQDESDAEFLLRVKMVNLEYARLLKERQSEEEERIQETLGGLGAMFGAYSQLFQALANENAAMAQFSRTLALFEIAMNQGKAIAAGIAAAQSMPFPANIGAIATTIAAIVSGITQALAVVNSAKQVETPKFTKMATGGLVGGYGSWTSDNVPTLLSPGESVVTGLATSMFSPALSAFNQIGGGVPIETRSIANEEMGKQFFRDAFVEAIEQMEPPVLVYDEFNNFQKTVRMREQRTRI